ncbi:MAG: helix-turn-helix transcriptional regulator [Clostridiales bacterium]|nr:helix-turn-helix transcriptional regulator [Clostridiales bacterium]
MTIGSRIAELRKQKGLSQEALGEALHVTRQSISKWESDSALPEIEKLVSMSHIFGVSVGALLGVEENPAAEGTQPSAAKDELTPAQLKMVEEIVSRYTEALREENERRREEERFRASSAAKKEQEASEVQAEAQAKSRRRKEIGIVAAAGALGVVVSLFSHRLDDLDSSYRGVQNTLVNMQSSVNREINSLANRVESILAEQNALTADYGCEINAVDVKKGTVTFTLYAVPKVYKEGMKVEFVAEYGKSSASAPAGEGENARFSGELTCPLEKDTGPILLSAAFYIDGERKTQPIETYDALYEATLPIMDVHSLNLMWKAAEPGKPFSLSGCQALVRGAGYSVKELPYVGGAPRAEEVRVGIFLNRKIAAWAMPYSGEPVVVGNTSGNATAAVPEMMEGDMLFAFGDEEITLQFGDELTVAAVIIDQYGREFLVADHSLTLLEDANELVWGASTDAVLDPAGYEY